MAEVRNQREGTLRWVVASGSGTAWATASAPASGLIGYCRGYTRNSGRTTTQVMDRGKATHHKVVSEEAIQVTFDLAYGVTADYPTTQVTGAGHTMPGLVHLEYRAATPERGATSAIYEQFYGVAINSMNFTEGNEENTLAFQAVALRMNGPTASGYLG